MSPAGGPIPRPARVPPTVRGLGAVSLFNDLASEMVYPLLPALLTTGLGAGATVLGVLDGAADLAAAGLKWVSGRLADRQGWRRPLIGGGYALAVVVRPLMALATSAWQVVGLRVGDRVGKGLRTPARDALIAAVTHPEARGRAFGFHRAADHAGAVLGALAAWVLLRADVSLRGVIAASLVPGVLVLAILWAVLRRVAENSPPSVPPALSDATGRVFWTPVLVLAGLVLLRVPEALLLLRLQDLGVAVGTIPLVWAGLHVVRTLASYPGGALTDRVGPTATVAGGSTLFAVTALLLGRPLGVPGAIGVFLAFGLVAGLTESAERTVVARLAPARTGRGFGAYHAVTGAAALPAGLFFGALYEGWGGPAALRWSAVGLLGVTALWLWAAPRRPAPAQRRRGAARRRRSRPRRR